MEGLTTDVVITDRSTEITRCVNTVGWEKLTPEQQRKIEDSLLIDNQLLLDMTNCHLAISGLEGKSSELNSNFFDANYKPAQEASLTLNQRREEIESSGFPSIVFITQQKNLKAGKILDKNQVPHSFLALGYDDSHEMVIWHKPGYRARYEITNLEAMCKLFSNPNFHNTWGTRRLDK